MAVRNKVVVLSDWYKDIGNNILIYKINNRYGIAYRDSVTEAIFDMIYSFGKSLILIDKMKGNLILIEENGNMHKHTYKSMLRNIKNLMGMQRIHNRSNDICEFILKYAIALEINLHLDEHMKNKFKGLVTKDLIRENEEDTYYIAYKIITDYDRACIEINIWKNSKKWGKYIENSGIYDIQNNRWVVNILELSVVHNDTYNRIVNYYFTITYFIKRDTSLTDKIYSLRTMDIYSVMDKFGNKYKIYSIKNKDNAYVYLYNECLKDINKVVTLRNDTSYKIGNKGYMVLNITKRIYHTNELISDDIYNQVMRINNKYNRRMDNCHILIDLITGTISTNIIVLHSGSLTNTRPEVEVISSNGNKYDAILDTTTCELKPADSNNTNNKMYLWYRNP